MREINEWSRKSKKQKAKYMDALEKLYGESNVTDDSKQDEKHTNRRLRTDQVSHLDDKTKY